jgi:hypothetical protein
MPTFRSNSWRASTAMASFAFGSPSVAIALSMSDWESAEKRARRMRADRGRRAFTTSITSKQMFSPSWSLIPTGQGHPNHTTTMPTLSQSNHKISTVTPPASSSKCRTMLPLFSTLTTGAVNSDAGSTASQDWYFGGKSVENTWPVTDVTRWRADRPSNVPSN